MESNDAYMARYEAAIARARSMPQLTADGVQIEVGGRYFDNDLQPVEVLKIADHLDGGPDGPAWHRTSRGTSDNGRLGYRHPGTRETVDEFFTRLQRNATFKVILNDPQAPIVDLLMLHVAEEEGAYLPAVRQAIRLITGEQPMASPMPSRPASDYQY